MRHPKLAGNADEGKELLGSAAVIHLASTLENGTPVLRALNAVVVDNTLLFHGAKAGEKSDCIGREAVAGAVQVVTFVPSHFTSKTNACPATTLYRSAQASGTLEEVLHVDTKARMLTALMQKYQPEGGYEPIDPGHPRYRGEVKGVRVFGLKLSQVSTKIKLAQNKDEQYLKRLIAGLKRRNAPGDERVIRDLLNIRQ